MGMKGWQACP